MPKMQKKHTAGMVVMKFWVLSFQLKDSLNSEAFSRYLVENDWFSMWLMFTG